MGAVQRAVIVVVIVVVMAGISSPIGPLLLFSDERK